MDTALAFRRGLGIVAAVMLLGRAVPVGAQVDISGEWAARVHEDQPHRGPGADLGDYSGLPINEAARQKARSWDASILSLPEEVANRAPRNISCAVRVRTCG